MPAGARALGGAGIGTADASAMEVVMTTQSANATSSPKTTKSGSPEPNKPSSRKSKLVLRALKRKSGVSVDELCKLTGWQAHSVRGFLSATVRKKLGHHVIRLTNARGVTRYSIGKSGAAS
jgi:hypothetical protein